MPSGGAIPKDTVVFFENEEGDFFFMILEGRIKVTILGDDGREIILSVLGPGDFFGEMALLDNEPRSATAIAIEETELLSLHRTDFQTALAENTEITTALIRSAHPRASAGRTTRSPPWPCSTSTAAWRA